MSSTRSSGNQNSAASQPAHRRVGTGFAATHPSSVARRRRTANGSARTIIRSGMLPLSGKSTRKWRAQSAIRINVRLCERFPRVAAGAFRGDRADRSAVPRRERIGSVSRVVLLSTTRRPARADGSRCGRSCHRNVGRAISRSRSRRSHCMGSDLRESWRCNGCEQSASTWTIVGATNVTERGAQGIHRAKRLLERARLVFALRLCATRARAGRTARVFQRALRSVRPVLGRMAI